LALLALPISSPAADQPHVYVILWFDTEDYLLPADDDATIHIAQFLTNEGIRGTFKLVGEKARVLERRKRADVIAALKKHEIGYHSNFHSVEPTPALYCSNLGWDEGVAEFDRREGGGRRDVERILGTPPTTYGQPGSSWAPQSYGAMRTWGMTVYLDGGRHVGIDDKPHYYCGILNLYRLAHMPRVGLANPKDLPIAQEKFAAARQALLAEGGGVVSIIYHPCEFVHKRFWDGVNFRNGANPPPELWKIPPAKSREETMIAFANFEEYVRFMKRFSDVRFITATDAVRLYADKARGRKFSRDDMRTIAEAVGEEITFQRHSDYALSPAEVFQVLNDFITTFSSKDAAREKEFTFVSVGPTGKVAVLQETVTTDRSQFLRTSRDVADFMRKHGRIPSAVWLGGTPVPPEAYLRTLAKVVLLMLDGKEIPDKLAITPTRFAAAKYVADDDPSLWRWVIFPPGFRAPALMDLAKRQAWTIKPAILGKGG
ncbi:MAG: hypothetical protein ACRD36_02855, partial [Candidatus Acidiferrum sp.]